MYIIYDFDYKNISYKQYQYILNKYNIKAKQ